MGRPGDLRLRTGLRQSGLTVLEILLASTLLLMFLSSLFGLVWATSDFRDKMEKAVRAFEIGPPVLDLIAQDLEHALVEPYKDLDAFHAEPDSMGGEDTTKLDFVAAVPSRARVEVDREWVRYGVNEVGYRMRRSEQYDDYFALFRREDPGVDDDPFEGGKYYKLMDRVASFRIDFFEEDPGALDGDEAEGVQEWDAKDEKGLPWGARITLVVIPPVDVDDRGEPIEDVKELELVRYVAFPQRFDDDQAGQ